MIVEFINGDWSNDGHGHTDHCYAEISGFLSLDQVKKAYEKGKADLGYGIEDIADGADDWISETQFDELEEDGLDFECQFDNFMLNGPAYLKIFEHIVKKHLPEFKAKMHYPIRHPLLWGGQEGQIIAYDFVGYGPLTY